MSESKYTPGILERNVIKGWELWIGSDYPDYHIADVHGQIDVRHANALRMVRCWNNHDALLEACRLGRNIAKWAADVRNAPTELQADIELINAAIAKTEKGMR